MSYINCAELARRTGISRAGVKKAIDSGRIDASYVRRAGGAVLVDAAEGMAVLGHHAKAKAKPAPAPQANPVDADWGGMLAWGEPDQEAASKEPRFEADDDQVHQLEQRLAAALARERSWLAAYYEFREWQTTGCDADIMRALPDPAPIGEVMVQTRLLLLSKLKELDEMELSSRAALKIWGKVTAEG